ncbi:MAG: PilZ domain-containing protein [Candidatus Electrothrix sp. GW3-4]|uniref:PilZ domain-containing protein n=1 Tax=Candidatus Electrothrix sp. GW3-4 TaxID=3126740 RepID=UPI0030CAAE7A
MEEQNRRRFSRVHLQWAVRLDFGVVEYKRFVHNVSLSGLYIEGDFRQMLGDVCIISLKQSGLFSGEFVQAVGTIARISEHGVAVEFLSMKLDSFFFLQATLFCKAVNPSRLGREFITHNIFELEGDLILFEPFTMDV